MLIGSIYYAQTESYTPSPRRRFGWVKDISGNPISRRVILIDHRTGSYISSTKSRASDGYWEIKGLPTSLPDNSIIEIAIDDTRTYESPARCHKSLVV